MGTLAAAMDRIIPAGDGPGAADAHAVNYVRQAWANPHTTQRFSEMEWGLSVLDALAHARCGRELASLSGDERDVVIGLLMATPQKRAQRFLAQLIRATLTGYLCSEEHGGNLQGAGWHLIGFAPGRPASVPEPHGADTCTTR